MFLSEYVCVCVWCLCVCAVEHRFIYAHNAAQWIIMQMERLMVKPHRLLLLPCCLYHVSQQIARFCTTYWHSRTRNLVVLWAQKRGGPKQIWQTAIQAQLFIYVYCSADTLVCFGVFVNSHALHNIKSKMNILVFVKYYSLTYVKLYLPIVFPINSNCQIINVMLFKLRCLFVFNWRPWCLFSQWNTFCNTCL